MVLLMIAATGLLSVSLVTYLLYQQGRQTEHLLSLLEPQLQLEGKITNLRSLAPVHGMEWWDVNWDGEARSRLPGDLPLDSKGRELALASKKSGKALVIRGLPWEPIWYAMPVPEVERTAVARLVSPLSLRARWTPFAVILCVLIGDVIVFTAFGSYLLRKRVILPLRAFSTASREMANGTLEVRLPVADIEEVGDAQDAFNHMAEALQIQTEGLEKVNAELLDANRSLYQARKGIERAERLALVGRLSAGVAHEIGNPMGAILAFIELASRDPGISEKSKGQLGRAMEQGRRVRSILQQLLNFSARSIAPHEDFSLKQVAEECLELVRAQRAYSEIEFSMNCEPELPLVKGNRNESTQIILNLLINAADAVRGSFFLDTQEDSKGLIQAKIKVGIRSVSWEDATQIAVMKAVECAVSDNGSGIQPEDRDRIFDPFFTTKPPGKGTGLGLANALQMAERQQGKLELRESQENSGACFVFGLPVAAPA